MALPAPPLANGSANSKIDLLSGDDLALVPVEPQPSASPVASDQNALALIDMFGDNTNSPSPATAPTGSSATQSIHLNPQLHQLPTSQQSNGFPPQGGYSQFEQQSYGQGASSPWNSQPAQQLQQPQHPSYGNIPQLLRHFNKKAFHFLNSGELAKCVSSIDLNLW